MSNLMLAGGLRPRVAKHSNDYVAEMLRRRDPDTGASTLEGTLKATGASSQGAAQEAWVAAFQTAKQRRGLPKPGPRLPRDEIRP